MKKKILIGAIALCTAFLVTACATPAPPTVEAPPAAPAQTAPATPTPTPTPAAPEAAAQNDIPETSVIRWNWGTSGNVLVTIAEERGYFAEYGLSIENVQATAIADTMTLLIGNQVDIVSNSGTAGPLQRIAAGVDLVSFGGHMVTGAMPVIVSSDSEFVNATGVEYIIGTRFAARPSFFAFTGAIMDLGYDPMEDVEWVVHPSYPDAVAALLRGDVDFALLGTGQNYMVRNQLADDVTIVFYHSTVMPNYSCCRLVANREFVENNPVTIRLMFQALIRAQHWFENNREEAVQLQVERMGVTEEFVSSFMLHYRYVLSLDPLKNATVRAWNILDATGFLDEEAANIDILDHINISIFEEAMEIVIERYGDTDPEFFNGLRTFFEEQNR